MRICLLTPEFPPVTSYTGGIGTQFAALAGRMAELGHEVHIVTIDDPDGEGTAPGLRLHLIPQRHLGSRLWPLQDPLWTARASRAIGRIENLDLVFAPEWRGHAALYARRKVRPPLVTNLTTSLEQVMAVSPGFPDYRPMRLQIASQTRAERWQSERSDALIACSQAILDWTRELWRVEAIPSVVIPNAIDIERVRQLALAEPPAAFPGDGPVVFYSGRLEPRKGVDILVKAMARVWGRYPEAKLVMAGQDWNSHEGPMSEVLRRLAGDYADRLVLLGKLPTHQVFPALARADVVALPSRWENLAVASLEALALGRPLVLTRAGGFPEIVTDGVDGLLVPPEDVDALADALLRVLADADLRRRLGQAAARRAQRYSIERVTDEHLAFFERVVARS